MDSIFDQNRAVHSRRQGSDAQAQIIPRLADDITVELNVPEVIGLQLAPRLQRRRDVEWLAIIRDARGKSGGLGRLKATGKLVEVFGRSISTLRPQVAAALSTALDEEIRAIMNGALGDAEEDSAHS
jgi:hypothetical protein